MPGEVDWDKARCRGLNTEIFYLEDSQLQDRRMNLKMIRKVCFNCPIQKECLTTAIEKGEEGIWGGLSQWERNELVKGTRDVRFLQSLRKDLAEFGLTLRQALGEEWYERLFLHKNL